MKTDCLCDQCTALCCRYFALEIDEPETPAQFDDVRWYLAHENVHVFIEDGEWFLAVQTKCQYLRDDNKCGIYEDRPRICREYSTDNCDYHTTQYDFEQYFTMPEQLEAYAQHVLGDRYARYAVKQREKNTGIDGAKKIKAQARKEGEKASGKQARKAFRHQVLASRTAPIIKGHPSSRPRAGRGEAGSSDAGAARGGLVELQVSAADSSGQAKDVGRRTR